jgi:hypothetical protein
MAEVKVTEQIGASAEVVWKLIRGFGDLASWAAGVERCEVMGEGVGAVRTLVMPGGLTLSERLESYDEGGRSFSYSMVEPLSLPLKNYLATVSIREEGPGRCSVEWSGTFEPTDAPAEQLEGMMRGVYSGSIAAVKKKLGV